MIETTLPYSFIGPMAQLQASEPSQAKGALSAIALEAPQQKNMSQAASKIQHAWKLCRKKMDFSGRFGAWYKEHHEDYIAHAIWHPMNIQIAFETGKIMPKEMIFRKIRKVEYEAGEEYGSRKIVDVTSFSDMRLEAIKQMPSDLAWYVRREERDPKYTRHPCQSYPFNWEEFLQAQRKAIADKKKSISSMKDHDDEEFWKSVSEAMFLESTVKLPEAGSNRHHQVENLFKKFLRKEYLREYHLMILRDELQDPKDRIDRILAQHYKNLIASGKKEPEAHDECLVAREIVTFPNKLDAKIHAGKNRIYWSYGDVVVLRGKGSAVTGAMISSYQAILLAPHQNGGEFFCLDLKREDTIILGPKEKLEKFKKEYGDRIVYIEELTPRQRNLMCVPKKLDPILSKMQDSREGLMSLV
jgi:hypothetical protein